MELLQTVRELAVGEPPPVAHEGLAISGDRERYADRLRRLGCECAMTKRRIKTVLPPDFKLRTLYELAGELGVQIRHLDYKKDSLQDIFMKAMENTNGNR